MLMSFSVASTSILRQQPCTCSFLVRRLRIVSSAPRRHRQSRLYSTSGSPAPPPQHTLAIIGGGLSGLSSAFYFLRALSPSARRAAKVVIFEKDERVGGWCRSVNIASKPDVKELDHEDGVKAKARGASRRELVFETGPRSIRPVGLSGWLTVEMAHEIGLTPEIITVAKTAPSAKNRYIYTPPRLTQLPSSLGSALLSPFTTPLIRSAMPGILLEPFRPRSPLHDEPDGGDESVDAFFTRRFGKVLAERMISAMIHGIYSGDTRRLSVRTVFPGLWEAEREWGSVIRSALFGGLWRKRGWKAKSAYRLGVEADDDKMKAIQARLKESGEDGRALVDAMALASVWGVRGGLERLTDQLRAWLDAQGVEVRTGAPASVERDSAGGWKVTTPKSTARASHVITTSTIPLPDSLTLPPVPSSTVAVINLAFPAPSPSEPRLFPPGFGYLIPRSVPTSANPHRVLGVIFDTDVMPEVDSSASDGIIKASILLGGSYWLNEGVPSPLPSSEALVNAAMETLRLHFPDTKFPTPIQTCTHIHRDCIPQVPPGHFRAVRELGKRLEALPEGHGRIGVVGAGLAAVGVNGAVKAAWEVGQSFARQVETGHGARTGTDPWM